VHLSFHDGLGRKLRKGLGVALVVAGVFGTIAWVLTPREVAAAGKKLEWIHGEKAGVAAARAAHKPALIDFFADWCIPCREMDVKTFQDERVARELSRFVLVKMDSSKDDDPVVKETTERYHADTLPTVVILDSDGKVAEKIDHFVTPSELLPKLQKVH
jgi:thiol:disulfide interchange protein DsbD